VRIPRIFLPVPLHPRTSVALDERAANHVVRVLRLRAGAEVVLFNGAGGEHPAVLTHVDKRRVEAEVAEHAAREVESPLRVTLLQGISRGERMDYTIQKAVELGVARILPVLTERSMVSLAGERLEKRLRHWQGVAASACEQCGRNRVPEVAEPATLAERLAEPLGGPGLVLHHRAEAGLAQLPDPAGDVHLLIGPEGGLAPAELASAERAGYLGVRLGPRILRTETAAVVALAALQAWWGDLG
jgi:16S rRNA (uracil1498-N3)-methyltransferase